MPWSADDAHRHTHKANTRKKQRQWSDVADKALASTGDEGLAIREANAAVSKHARKRRLNEWAQGKRKAP